MSWFKKTPTLKQPQKQQPYRYSPATEKAKEESKLAGPTEKKKN